MLEKCEYALTQALQPKQHDLFPSNHTAEGFLHTANSKPRTESMSSLSYLIHGFWLLCATAADGYDPTSKYARHTQKSNRTSSGMGLI